MRHNPEPMLDFRSFHAAGAVLAGMELIHMSRKGQVAIDGADELSLADQLSALAGMVRPVGTLPFSRIPTFDHNATESKIHWHTQSLR